MLVMSSTALAAAQVVAEPDGPPYPVCFSVHARAEPGVMPRVVELFAKRGLVPQRFHGTAVGSMLTIEVHVHDLGADVADYVARCMRQITGVDAVLTSEISPPG
jgi:acetolactate synthase small subunit